MVGLMHLGKLHQDALEDNRRKFLGLIDARTGGVLLDCGCGDGQFTMKVAEKMEADTVYGVDVDADLLRNARRKWGVNAHYADLNEILPFPDRLFNVIMSNQTMEHIFNLDGFISELHRCLKPDGYTVLSTENLASWHNIFSLLLGYQPFSSTVSTVKHIGNPLSTLYMTEEHVQYVHNRILTLRALKELLQIHGFKITASTGAGYHPLRGRTASKLSSWNLSHAHFITAKAVPMAK